MSDLGTSMIEQYICMCVDSYSVFVLHNLHVGIYTILRMCYAIIGIHTCNPQIMHPKPGLSRTYTCKSTCMHLEHFAELIAFEFFLPCWNHFWLNVSQVNGEHRLRTIVSRICQVDASKGCNRTMGNTEIINKEWLQQLLLKGLNQQLFSSRKVFKSDHMLL